MNKADFEILVRDSVHRDGVSDLLKWLDTTDFYTAPASTRYHGAGEGGLLEHSFAVYTNLYAFNNMLVTPYTDESVALVALFHDLCKVNCYHTETRWRKDVNNRWECYPVYTFKDNAPFGGHGSKSVYILQSFVALTWEEASAINAHMGEWEATNYGKPSEVYEANTLAWLLHVADEKASFIDKK